MWTFGADRSSVSSGSIEILTAHELEGQPSFYLSTDGEGHPNEDGAKLKGYEQELHSLELLWEWESGAMQGAQRMELFHPNLCCGIPGSISPALSSHSVQDSARLMG